MTDPAVPAAAAEPLEYGLSPQLRARFMGVALGAIGVLLVVATVLVAGFDLPPDILSAVVLLVVVGVFGLGFLLVRRWYVVRLDATGYQVRFVRSAGVKSARWPEVEDLQTTTMRGLAVVVLRLRDGRTTVIPVDLLAGDRDGFVDELQRRLDAGHGYRRIK